MGTRLLRVTPVQPLMRGSDAPAVQMRRLAKRYAPGKLDGVYGNIAKAAAVALQTAYGIKADGVVGLDTRVFYDDGCSIAGEVCAGWVFVEVYTDEGITGTNTKKREGFNQMVADTLAGKIDLIVTKSVSRFARNTVNSLVTVRKLKERGMEIFFEKENIWALDSKGELLIKIMPSLAQEESRSISENVTWGQRKRFADGKVSMPYKHFLGYEKNENSCLWKMRRKIWKDGEMIFMSTVRTAH